MVKNTKGGKAAKSQARKNQNVNRSANYNNMDLADNINTYYAIVTKVFGNGRYDVNLFVKEIRHFNTEELEQYTPESLQEFRDAQAIQANCSKTAIIRKPNHRIKDGSVLLVSIRDFETVKKNVDIIKAYNSDEINVIISNNQIPSSFCKQNDITSSSGNFDIEFSNDNEVAFEDL